MATKYQTRDLTVQYQIGTWEKYFPYLNEGDIETVGYIGTFVIQRENWTPKLIGTNCPADESAVMIEQTNPVRYGGGLVQWSERYEQLPQRKDIQDGETRDVQYSSAIWTPPKYVAGGATLKGANINSYNPTQKYIDGIPWVEFTGVSSDFADFKDSTRVDFYYNQAGYGSDVKYFYNVKRKRLPFVKVSDNVARISMQIFGSNFFKEDFQIVESSIYSGGKAKAVVARTSYRYIKESEILNVELPNEFEVIIPEILDPSFTGNANIVLSATSIPTLNEYLDMVNNNEWVRIQKDVIEDFKPGIKRVKTVETRAI